jgi:type III secretory pathway component EscV
MNMNNNLTIIQEQEIDSSVWGFIKCTANNCKYIEIIAFMSIFCFVGFLLLIIIICCLLCKLIYERKKFNYKNHHYNNNNNNINKSNKRNSLSEIEMNDIIDAHAYTLPLRQHQEQQKQQQLQERPSNIPKNSIAVLPKIHSKSSAKNYSNNSENDYQDYC